jgi:hypothetical protein
LLKKGFILKEPGSNLWVLGGCLAVITSIALDEKAGWKIKEYAINVS